MIETSGNLEPLPLRPPPEAPAARMKEGDPLAPGAYCFSDCRTFRGNDDGLAVDVTHEKRRYTHVVVSIAFLAEHLTGDEDGIVPGVSAFIKEHRANHGVAAEPPGEGGG